MDIKYKIIIISSAMVVAFAAGRYTVPEKIKVETKVVEVVKTIKVKDTDITKKKRKKITKTVIIHPDGTKEENTVITDDVDTDKKVDETVAVDKTKDKDTVKQETKNSDKVTLSALGGWDLNLNKPVFGASLTKPVLGPITLGAWVLTNLSFGASVGVTF